jgi:uncharacterized DUF497 family protein
LPFSHNRQHASLVRTKHEACSEGMSRRRAARPHGSAVITYRGETIRLISVRRSRAKEVQAYEGE